MGDRIDKTAAADGTGIRLGFCCIVLNRWLQRRATLRGRAVGVLLGWALLFPTVNAGNLPTTGGTTLYHLPVEDASIALHEFSRQSGVQLVFPMSAVRGIQTSAVEGFHSVAEALHLLLANTSLEAVHDTQTGAWAVRRVPPPLPPKKPQRRASPSPESSDEPVEMDAFSVRSRRDAGIQTQTIFRTDAEAPIYHQVITRKQIDALGVTSVAELMTMVSGYSGEGIENLQSSVNLSLEGSGTVVYSGAFLKLRGFDSTRSAVLLNGRRLPVNVDSRGPDLSRIPLAAVERVNVLPFSGSALYGDNVIGGAVDIVLRKDYVGRSLSWLYGTTTQGGGNESALTAVEGTTVGDGKTKATFILDYQHRSALRMSDRDFWSRAAANHPLEDVWQQLRISRSTLSSDDLRYLETASPSYPAVVLVDSSTLGLGIPGKADQPFAVLPRGQDGMRLVPSDFRLSPSSTTLERRNQRAILRRPSETYSFTAQIEHAFVPEKWEMYAEMGYSRAIDRFSSGDLVSPLRLDLFDPLNPFRNEVVPGFVGRSIYVFFDPVDLPDNTYDQVRSGARLVVGMKGYINERWNWTVDSSFDHTDTHTTIDSPNMPLNALLSSANAAPHAFGLSLYRIYNPLADHRAFPISAEMIQRYFQYRSVAISKADVYAINARIYGTPLELPAGPLGVSVRGEYRREMNNARTRIDSSPDFDREVINLSRSPTLSSDQFDSLSLAGEVRVPLIGSRWRPIPLDTVELNEGTRASRTFEGKVKFTQTLALKIAPASWIGLRGSYSEGYMPPPVSARRAPVATFNNIGGIIDPLPNPQYATIFSVLQGGNPTLQAETSVAKVAGIILQPRFASGMSFTTDFWSIEGRNGIRVLLPQEILEHPELFANRVTRAPPDAFGRTRVTIDDRPINLATETSSGVDLNMTGRWDFSRNGAVDFSAMATFVQSYREQVFASEPPVDLLSRVGGNYRTLSAASPQLPMHGRATLGWEKGNFRLAVTANYASPYVAQTVKNQVGVANTLKKNQDFETVSSSTLWDLQINYVTSRISWGRGRTTCTLGVRNLFDRTPSYRSDGVAFYSHFEDPRMRFVYLRVQQEW